jgi:hypothetical protein
MKKYLLTSKSLFVIHIPTLIILFALYLIYNYYYKNKNKNESKKENFTPKIRETYRPYLRHARIVSEGFYGDNKNNINHLFRKFGLY